MSQANVEIVRRAVGHFLAGRTDQWTEGLDPEVEWDPCAYPAPGWPARGTGRDPYLRHLGDHVASWNAYGVTIGDVFDAGEDAVSIWHERVCMPDRDLTLERELPAIWTVRDGGTLHRLRAFKTREEALAAAGLEG